MKISITKLAAALLGILILSSCAGNNSANNIDNNSKDFTDITKNTAVSETIKVLEAPDLLDSFDSSNSHTTDKKKVINMFMTYGEYSDGTYYIRKYSTANPCSFLYSFSYKPEIDMFNCSVLVTTYTSIATTYDYGSVTFSWNNFSNALFYGYHELENIAMVEFDFSALNPQSNMTYKNYNYSVRSNSFKNLTNTSDINGYAQTCFECINQSLSYAQSLLYGYTSTVMLW